MANWKSTVKIGDLHKAYEDKELTVPQLARAVATRFYPNSYVKNGINEDHDDYDEDLVWALQDMLDGACTDTEEYDSCLATLYDFGDYDHRIWIDTLCHG